MGILDIFRRRAPAPSGGPPQVVPVAASRPPDEDWNEIPISGLANWTVSSIRGACQSHCDGQFYASSILAESMVADDRIQSALNGRVKGVTRCEPRQEPAPLDAEGVVADEVQELWPDVVTEEVVEQAMFWAVFSGFALFRVDWEARDGRWVPSLYPWNLRNAYFDWTTRRFVAVTEEGPVQVDPVLDPRWMLWTPYGYGRTGYIRAGVRSLSIPWVVRSFAARDWARFSEKHGLPVTLAKVPAMASAADKERFFRQVRNLGAESTILLPTQAGSDGKDWDAMLLEARDTSWKSFPGLVDFCERAITLTIRGTNLTSQVEGGSYAAAQVHRDEDSDYAESDVRKLCRALRARLWSLYAHYNHGDSRLAPRSFLDPPDSVLMGEYGDGLSKLSAGIVAARGAGLQVDAVRLAERFDVPLLSREPAPLPDPAPEPGEGTETGASDGEEALASRRRGRALLLNGARR